MCQHVHSLASSMSETYIVYYYRIQNIFKVFVFILFTIFYDFTMEIMVDFVYFLGNLNILEQEFKLFII
jgi:hypothetical protein